MMGITEKKKAYEEQFASLEDAFDRYTYLLSLSNRLPVLSESLKQDDYLFKECQSKVWLIPEVKEGRFLLKCESDVLLLRGLLWILSDLTNGEFLEDVAQADLELLEPMKLQSLITDERKGGVSAMIAYLQKKAETIQRQQKHSDTTQT